MKAIIFAGGVGTRLWPLSRKSSPKQFEKIIDNKSTLQLAAERLIPLFSWKDIYIATGKPYFKIVSEQLPQIPPAQIISEPEMRDVGPAVGLVVSLLYKISPKEPIVILWSDHLVRREKLFREILFTAGKFIEKNPNRIILIGQKPRFASQNLGWIGYGKETQKIGKFSLYYFKNFVYSPDLKTANKFFRSGQYAWNLGYFVTTPHFLWKEYEKNAPIMYKNLKIIQKSWDTAVFSKTLTQIYPRLEKVNFDNLILGKIDPTKVLVISENLEWSDVGTWDALKEALQKHTSENVTQGKTLITDCEDSLIYNYTNQLVTAIDLKSLLVINTNDVILVCRKDSVPKIKKLVENLIGTENEHLT